nr:UDP-N-acetylmuramate--L-alanine ligase [Candidatus Gracilibacteria bacterium]
MKKIYVIGIGGIGVSAIARYYNENGYQVFGSDKTDSELIHKLRDEGIDIFIGERPEFIDNKFDLVVYTEAIPNSQSELEKSRELNLNVISYPTALAEIANKKQLITIAGTHGKSTTTSLISIVLKNSNIGVNSVVGSILKEFGNKNSYFSNSKYFALEACEYKRSFLKYKPFIGVITNIELDHLDYYKDLDDYLSAFKNYLENIIPGGYVILNGNCINSMKLLGLRNDINYVIVENKKYKIKNINGITKDYNFPNIELNVPGEHILYDAKIAYVVGKVLNLDDSEITKSLKNYNGIWRRSEIIGMTLNGNILMSDYGHHPTEILLNTKAIKEKYSQKKIVCIFQPHQYNRTLELLEDFKNCFKYVDKLIIPDIYESRDTEEDKKKINSEKLVSFINHSDKLDGKGLENTLDIILDYDKKNPTSSVIILQGAGNVDDLRYRIKTIN